MKQPNKEGLVILDELINVIEFPETFNEKMKKLMVAILQVIKGRMTAANDELFIAELSKSEYEKFLKNIFDEYSISFLSAKLKKEYEGADNEIS